MKKVVVSGKTVEEALMNGLAQLNTTEDRVKVTVLEHPSKGLFGLIGSRPAKLEVELIPDAIEETLLFLQDVFAAMNLHIRIECRQEEDATLFDLSGENIGILIGRRGQTLDALQYLANLVANRHSDSYVKIILDAERFRERRKKTLEDLAMRLAARAVRTKKDIVLEPMTPQERKVIHTRLQDHPEVKTYSKGDEPNRRVVITLK